MVSGRCELRSLESDVVNMLVTEMEAAGISIIRGEAAALSETGDKKTKQLELVSG